MKQLNTTDFDEAHYQRPIMNYVFMMFLMLGTLGFEMFMPGIADMSREFHTSIGNVQTTLTLYLLGVGFGQLIFGPLSDRYGRLSFLVISLALYSISSLLCAIVPSLEVLFLARLFQGLGAAGCIILSRAIIADTHDLIGTAKMMGFTFSGVMLGTGAGPILGGYIVHFASWRITFAFSTLFGVAGLILVYFFIRETNIHRGEPQTHLKNLIKNFMAHLTDLRFLSFAACISLAFLGYMVFAVVAPTVFYHIFNVPETDFGWLMLLMIIGFIAGSFVGQLLVKRFFILNVILLGTIIMCITGFGMFAFEELFGDSLLALIIGLGILNFGIAVAYANCQACLFRLYTKSRGTAGSISGFIQFFAPYAVGSYANSLHPSTIEPYVLIISATALLMLVMAIVIRRYKNDLLSI